jgi:oxygen-independent coproporphyrinogen III oxidase
MSLLSPVHILSQSPYQDYVYAYPHKTAYRSFASRRLEQVWAGENLDALFLYIHIPFCGMRCGFCNLFTMVLHDEDFIAQYMRAVKRQAQRFQESLGDVQFARFALGGGTPTQLSITGLEAVLDIAAVTLGAKLPSIPMSVEISPETATLEKLQLLYDRGTDRISMGVQSFLDREVRASQRPQTAEMVRSTLANIRQVGFPTLNLDLIYGLPGQTVESWLYSLRQALEFQPEELYLYPLYRRPLTGLGMGDREWDDIRLACYRAGRELLLAAGYQQQSMRMFQLSRSIDTAGPLYCCQADGMVGLGCGARSYTRSLHYSYDYAVDAKEIRAIIARYIANDDAAFDQVSYGIELNPEEQQRRFLLLSLLSAAGLNLPDYSDRFGTSALNDFGELAELQSAGLVAIPSGTAQPNENSVVSLTEMGLERADAIGPLLFSPAVRTLMQTYQVK